MFALLPSLFNSSTVILFNAGFRAETDNLLAQRDSSGDEKYDGADNRQSNNNGVIIFGNESSCFDMCVPPSIFKRHQFSMYRNTCSAPPAKRLSISISKNMYI